MSLVSPFTIKTILPKTVFNFEACTRRIAKNILSTQCSSPNIMTLAHDLRVLGSLWLFEFLVTQIKHFFISVCLLYLTCLNFLLCFFAASTSRPMISFKLVLVGLYHPS